MPTRPNKRTRAPIRNLVGLEIRRCREEKGWSQADLARELQLAGWDVERTVLTKVELRRRCVTDYELFLFAETLGVAVGALIPKRVDKGEFFTL